MKKICPIAEPGRVERLNIIAERHCVKHKIESLPNWAQRLICDIEFEREKIASEYDRLDRANLVASGKNWFTLHGPKSDSKEEYYGLWMLNSDQPHRVCSLGRNDILLIGRAK